MGCDAFGCEGMRACSCILASACAAPYGREGRASKQPCSDLGDPTQPAGTASPLQRNSLMPVSPSHHPSCAAVGVRSNSGAVGVRPGSLQKPRQQQDSKRSKAAAASLISQLGAGGLTALLDESTSMLAASKAAGKNIKQQKQQQQSVQQPRAAVLPAAAVSCTPVSSGASLPQPRPQPQPPAVDMAAVLESLQGFQAQ